MIKWLPKEMIDLTQCPSKSLAEDNLKSALTEAGLEELYSPESLW